MAIEATEIAGVSKLIFSLCAKDLRGLSNADGAAAFIDCEVKGANISDEVLATKNVGTSCFSVSIAEVNSANNVRVGLLNGCGSSTSPGNVQVSLMVYQP